MPFVLCFQAWHSLIPFLAGTSLHQVQGRGVMYIYLTGFITHKEWLRVARKKWTVTDRDMPIPLPKSQGYLC